MTTAPPSEAEQTEVVPDVVEPLVIGPTWTRGEDGKFVCPEFTLGWHVLVWTAAYLQHAGGRPWRYTNEQVRLVLWWFAMDPETGEFLYRDAVLQRLKGWGKDPFAATLCAVEFIGPARPSRVVDAFGRLVVRVAGPADPSGVPQGQPLGEAHPEAWVQIAAVSQDQTRNTMTLFPGLFTKKAIVEFGIDLGKEIIYAFKGRCRIEAVTSSPRALEGGRTTFTLMNETHHWVEGNGGHEMSAVIERNATKSADGAARTFAITNAFEPGEDSVAERTRDAYESVEAGQTEDTGILYDSLEAPPEARLTKEWIPKVLEAVRGDSVWLNIPRIVKSILDKRNPPSRSQRFWYNRVVAAEDSWMARYEWDACARPDSALADGDQVVLFFDGSKSDDATGLVACRVEDGLVATLGVWQRPAQLPADEPWTVPRDHVDGVVANAFTRFKVLAFFADPGSGQDGGGELYWDAYLEQWGQTYGKKLLIQSVTSGAQRHAVRWDMRDRRRQQQFTEAVGFTYEDILERRLVHDGHRVLRQHVINARRRTNAWGVTIGKEHRESARKVDLAVCMVGARMLRRQVLNSREYAKKPRTRGKGRVVVLR